MIFIINGEPDNFKAIRWLLMNFELASGLSVNYKKCWAYGINLHRDELLTLVGDFGCQVGSFPIPYLGLKVGGNLRYNDGWQDICCKIERRIKKWDAKNLSMAGRITIIRSVLASIPTYALSFMPLPKTTYNSITRLQRDFLWGRQGDAKKIAWIKWEDLYLPKSEGGLGFTNLISFNKALLCKWVWRFLSTENCLWKRLIISRHGEPPWLKTGVANAHYRKPSSGWWRKITSFVDGDSGSWFWSLLRRQLGDGKTTSFWNGMWMDCPSLKSQFPRLFNLSVNKEALVSNMGAWVDGIWSWDLKWRRRLRSSEEAAASALLQRLTIPPSSTSMPDVWIWSKKPSNMSCVRHMYLELEKARCPSSRPRQPELNYNLIWKSTAPHKAQSFGWRLCKNRLPTRDNLRKRIDWQGADTSCCFCRKEEESGIHLFLECEKVRLVWNNISSWIGIAWAAPKTLKDHFLSFSHLRGGKNLLKYFSGLWICLVWVWWKWRNAIVFEKKSWNIHRIIDEVKCRFWSWCVAHGAVDATLNFDSWNQSLRLP